MGTLHISMAVKTLFWLCLASGLCLTTVTGCSSSSPYDDYKIVRKTDAGGKQLVVATEENAQLFCQTNVPWKKCWWKPPRNGVRQLKCEFVKGPNNQVTNINIIVQSLCKTFKNIMREIGSANLKLMFQLKIETLIQNQLLLGKK